MNDTTDIKQLFDDAVAAGHDKNQTLMVLISEGGLDVVSAMREYTKLAREAGITMSAEQREAKIEEILSASDVTTSEGLNVARKDLMDGLDVAPSTASGYIKKYADTNNIEVATNARSRIASREDVVEYLLEHRGEKKSVLSAGITETFGYAKGAADTIVSSIRYMEEYSKQMAELTAE